MNRRSFIAFAAASTVLGIGRPPTPQRWVTIPLAIPGEKGTTLMLVGEGFSRAQILGLIESINAQVTA